MPQQRSNEIQIFLTSSYKFGYCQVVDLQAQRRSASSVFIADGNKPFPPARRQCCGFFADAMCVVAESLMKRRTLTDSAIDEVGVLWTAIGKQIGFDGNEQLLRWIWKLAEDCLATNDNKFVRPGNCGCGADNVLKVRALHAVGAF